MRTLLSLQAGEMLIATKTLTNTQWAGYYIWRTLGDNNVRASHAANNGKLFAWDSPPDTGHPGEDYNCRCIAEPYVAGTSEIAYQTIISHVDTSRPKWSNIILTWHYYFGGGQGIELWRMGHLQGVIDFYFYKLGRYDAVNNQIIQAARERTLGEFGYHFDGSYGFGDYLYVFGGGVVSGLFSGTSRMRGNMMVIEGTVEYFYDDTFTDPVSLRENFGGSSNPENMNWVEQITEFGGTHYPIADRWKTAFYAEVHPDAHSSIYHWPR